MLPADDQRAIAIKQHARNATQDARRCQRRDRAGLEHSGVPGRAAAARLVAIDQRHAKSLSPEPERATGAQDAGADDNDMAAHRASALSSLAIMSRTMATKSTIASCESPAAACRNTARRIGSMRRKAPRPLAVMKTSTLRLSASRE